MRPKHCFHRFCDGGLIRTGFVGTVVKSAKKRPLHFALDVEKLTAAHIARANSAPTAPNNSRSLVLCVARLWTASFCVCAHPCSLALPSTLEIVVDACAIFDACAIVAVSSVRTSRHSRTMFVWADKEQARTLLRPLRVTSAHTPRTTWRHSRRQAKTRRGAEYRSIAWAARRRTHEWRWRRRWRWRRVVDEEGRRGRGCRDCEEQLEQQPSAGRAAGRNTGGTGRRWGLHSSLPMFGRYVTSFGVNWARCTA